MKLASLRLPAIGLIAILVWFFFSMLPYLLHRDHWQHFRFGDRITWVNGNDWLYSTYYSVGLFRGFEILLIFGLLCCIAPLITRLARSWTLIPLLILCSIVMTFLLARSFHYSGLVMKALE